MCTVLWIAFLTTNSLVTRGTTRQTEEYLADKISAIGRMVANSEIVIEGLSGQRPTEEIAVYANEVEHLTNTKFVVVLDMDLIRKSHPVKSEIGNFFSNIDDAAASLEGKEYVTLAEGLMGYGKRAFTPVIDEEGNQIGVVVVGIGIDAVNEAIRDSRQNIYISMLVGISIGVIGAAFLGTHIKSILFNLEPFQIATLLKEREAMLDSVKDGVIAVDRDLKITLINDSVSRILNEKQVNQEMTEDYIRNYLPMFEEILITGKEQLHIEGEIYDIPLIFNCVPIIVENEVVGALGTFQDKTELKKMGQELAGIQLYTDALRAQSHEFMNKLHVVLGLVQMKDYQKLENYIQQIVHRTETEFNFIVDKIKSPVFAGFLLGKYSKAREERIEFILTSKSYLPEIKNNEFMNQLIEIVGNLINNAVEAVIHQSTKKIILGVHYQKDHIDIEVIDNGPGIERQIRESIFEKGFSTKGEKRGLGLFLIYQTVRSLKGDIELYTIVGKGTTFKIKIPYRNEKGVDELD